MKNSYFNKYYNKFLNVKATYKDYGPFYINAPKDKVLVQFSEIYQNLKKKHNNWTVVYDETRDWTSTDWREISTKEFMDLVLELNKNYKTSEPSRIEHSGLGCLTWYKTEESKNYFLTIRFHSADRKVATQLFPDSEISSLV